MSTRRTARSTPRSAAREAPPAQVAGVTITRPDKIWWADEGITKLDVVRFYADIAPRLLPWMAGRPLAAERCPDGMRGQCVSQDAGATDQHLHPGRFDHSLDDS